MKFLVDAKLPRRMCRRPADSGLDALHALDLPLGYRTPDEALILNAIASRPTKLVDLGASTPGR